MITPIGFGAFKIGRNTGIKYAQRYDLPTDDESDRLLHAVVDELGINYIDTAPAYGLSEERVGGALGARKDVVFSTKVGENFENGVSNFDFSDTAVRASVARSCRRLRRDALDIVFVHSNGEDHRIQQSEDVVATLQALKAKGDIRAIGFSGKTVEGAFEAIDSPESMSWADVLMIEYHQQDLSHKGVMTKAHALGVGVILKKVLASGALSAHEAIQWAVRAGGNSALIGSLNLEHLRQNVASAMATGSAG